METKEKAPQLPNFGVSGMPGDVLCYEPCAAGDS